MSFFLLFNTTDKILKNVGHQTVAVPIHFKEDNGYRKMMTQFSFWGELS